MLKRIEKKLKVEVWEGIIVMSERKRHSSCETLKENVKFGND